MTTTSWTARKFGLVATAVASTAAVAALSFALANPSQSSNDALGPEWRCSTSLFWTSCTKISQIEPVVESVRKETPCPPRRGLSG